MKTSSNRTVPAAPGRARPGVPFAPILSLLLLFSLAAVSGCATTIDLPTVTPDAGHLAYPGKFVWFDLYAPDIGAVARFYDRVFGWSVERTDPGSATVKTILNKDRRIGTIFLVGGGEPWRGHGPGWVACLSVDDADRAFARAQSAGAKAVNPPEDRPYRGRMAEIRDPQGARVSLLASSVGDPRDRAPEDGAFLGAELWSADVPSSERFYAGLAGYEADRISLRGVPYVMLLAGNRPRGAITAPPDGFPGAVWIPMVAARDVAGVVERVEACGGTVLLRPAPGDGDGAVAVFRDPAGGLMGVRGFTPAER
ncbi:VOC family protein [Desulfovibrio caledoniensis]